MPAFTLDKLVPGESGKITKVHGKGAIRRRLVDMGLTSGSVIEMVKISPLGDPVEYRLRGYHLSLRKSEAETIEIDLLGGQIPENVWEHTSRSAVPLGRCQAGLNIVIKQIRGGRRLQGKLRELGLLPGTQLQVIQNEFPGPMIISLKDNNRRTVGKGMARHILVEPA